MLNDAKGFSRIIIACGRTDLRRGIDGLAAVVAEQFLPLAQNAGRSHGNYAGAVRLTDAGYDDRINDTAGYTEKTMLSPSKRRKYSANYLPKRCRGSQFPRYVEKASSRYCFYPPFRRRNRNERSPNALLWIARQLQTEDFNSHYDESDCKKKWHDSLLCSIIRPSEVRRIHA